jgi:hypothetical protein
LRKWLIFGIMKKWHLLHLLSMFWLCNGALAQGVAIGNTTGKPHGSAILDLQSVKGGMLLPRLTTAQRNAIDTPARSLLIFNVEEQSIQVNMGTPQQPLWSNAVLALPGQAQQWAVGGNTVNNRVASLGTTNGSALTLITGGSPRLFIDTGLVRIGIGTTSPATSLHINATDAVQLPVGTTQQRPPSPQPGMIRFNSTTGKLEGFTNSGWVPLHQ